jgi:hypothetical protein
VRLSNSFGWKNFRSIEGVSRVKDGARIDFGSALTAVASFTASHEATRYRIIPHRAPTDDK